jgi:tetratricopeptide (TPR) repeat protein
VAQDNSATSFARGNAALAAGDFKAAEQIFQGVVQQDPAAHDAWLALALIALRAGAPDIAVERARRAVDLDRNNALYLNNLGIAYSELGDLRAAEKACRRALRINPAYGEGHYNLAKALHKQGRHRDALQEYERAHKLKPQSMPMLVGLCMMYRLLGEPERALPLLRAAAAKEDQLPDTLVSNLAECIADVEGTEAAIAWLRELVARQPKSANTHYTLAVLLLSLGQWRDGWRQYLWRQSLWSAPGGRARAESSAPLPQRLDGKRVLLRSEQGLGDILFFLRFAAELRSHGAELALDCPDKLVPLLAEKIDVNGSQPSDFDIFVGDLPALLDSDATPGAFKLNVSDAASERVRLKLERLGPPPYLGLTWRAGTDVVREYGANLAVLFKNISPRLLGEAVRGWPGTLLSVQRAPAPEELQVLCGAAGAPVHDLSPLNDDLVEMLALLAQLDEYVAVSNTNIHLLAGVGGSARVLLSHPPEWRWMRRDGRSDWFPAFPVYRRGKRRDWTDALKRLREDLLGAAKSPPRARA